MVKWNTEPAPLGHNNPPSDIELLQQSIELKYIDLFQRGDKYIAMEPPEKFNEQFEVDYASDIIKIIQTLQKQLEDARKESKEPFLRQGQFVDTFFKEESTKLEKVRLKLHKPLQEFMLAQAQAEKERRDKEAEELRQAEVAALAAIQKETTPEKIEEFTEIQHSVAVAEKLAAVPVEAMSSVSTKISATKLNTVFVGKVVDKEKLDIKKLLPYIKDDALQVALNAFIKFGGRELAGAEIKSTLEAKVK